jgi:CRP/FNR family transcriptional regulator
MSRGSTAASRRWDEVQVTPSNFLARLDAADRAALFAAATRSTYAKGDYVFRAGDPGIRVYLLEEGRIKIHQLAPSGRDVILWFCLPGEIFGVAEVARGGGRVVNALACESCTVLVLPQEAFRQYLAAHPAAALLAIEMLSARLRLLGDVLVNLVSDDAYTRIAKLLLRLASRYGVRDGEDVRLSIPLTHQEIADMVGTTRQTVTTVLNELKRIGALSIDSHRIHIESAARLAEIGASGAGGRPG